MNKKITLKILLFISIILIIFISSFFNQKSIAAGIAWDGGGDGSSWSDPLNWSGDVVPTGADDVTINSNVTVSLANYSLDRAIGGAPTASGSFVAATMFNNNISDSTGSGSAGPHWVKYDLGAGNQKIITEYSIRAGTSASSDGPKQWVFQGSNDDAIWIDIDTQTNQTGWTNYSVRYFAVTNVSTYRYYRWNALYGQGAGNWVQLSELEIMEPFTNLTINSLTLGNGSGTTSPILNFNYNSILSSQPLIVTTTSTVYLNARITHTVGNSAVVATINLQSTDLIVTGSINVNAKGYAIAQGPGKGTVSSGGAYGGDGGDSGTAGGVAYGSVTQPVDLGSGGTGQGIGGGAAKVTVTNTLNLTGSITANGNNGTDSGAGGGAGGSLYLTANTFTGNGSITSNGGTGHVWGGGGGGGGRIALYYTTDSSTYTVTAYGGTQGVQYGGAGTIYRKLSAQPNGDLLIDNNNTYTTTDDRFSGTTSINANYTFNAITIRNYGNLALESGGNITYSSLDWATKGIITDNGGVFTLLSGGGDITVPASAYLVANTNRTFNNIIVSGNITHTGNLTSEIYKINLTASNFTVNAGGSVMLDGKGNRNSEGTGAGGDGSASGAGGASHGGQGAQSGGTRGVIYGSLTQPETIGSGGGNGSGVNYPGGAGGGAIKLTVANTITLNGAVSAKGLNYADSWGGGGSGGSIYFIAVTIAGNSSGTISTNGGNGHAWGGGSGGGGRIALEYTSKTASGTISSYGGTNGSYSGGAGTIYLKPSGQVNGDLLIDNNNNPVTDDRYIGRTSFTTGVTFQTITLQNYGNIAIENTANITYSSLNWSTKGVITDNGGTFSIVSGGGDLTVPATSYLFANTTRSFNNIVVNGIITHSNNLTTETYKLNLTAVSLTINSGASINVDGRGYKNSEGTGQGGDGSTGGGGGASYGGLGGLAAGSRGVIYGSLTQPENIGSGGGNCDNSSNVGGQGGGAVKLTISNLLTLTGTITANGLVGTGSYYGGGSGGAVYITTNNLGGAGTINVNGGNGNSPGGGGGGGRIAMYYTTDTSSISYTTYGGSQGERYGGAGTIYKKPSGQTYGDLLIDNNNQAVTGSDQYYGRTLINSTQTFNIVTIKNYGNLETQSASNITASNFDWSTKGVYTDNGGIISLVTSNLTVPATAYYFANTNRTYTSLQVDGTITHSSNQSAETYKINLSISNNLTVAASGSIDASGKGFIYGYGTGKGGSSSSEGGGGGHGGIGGGTLGGVTYDSLTGPVNLGSSGGSRWGTGSPGGTGGGAVNLSVGGIIAVNGTIYADGGAAQGGMYEVGGGSGGAINIAASNLTGNGLVRANGGVGNQSGGGGSGGRVAFSFTTSSAYFGVQVNGGTGGAGAGAVGTIYPALYPTISTQVTTNVTDDTATGNGSVDAISIYPITQHGHVWSTDMYPSLLSPHAYWKLNDNSANTTVVDTMGLYSGVATRNTNLLTTTGKLSGAFHFDGASDYVTTGDYGISGSNARSIVLWFKTTVNENSQSNWATLISSTEVGNLRSFNLTVKDIECPTLEIAAHYWGGNTCSGVKISDLTAGWHQVTLTYNGVEQQIYIDSILKRTTAYALNTVAGVNNIGRRQLGTGYFNGDIDDVRIYNRSLTITEIQQLYNGGNGSEYIDVSPHSLLGIKTSTGSFSSSLSSLTNSTIYYVKSYAITPDGTVTYGSADSFTTYALNNVPVATTPSSINQANNGTGYLSFQTTISDADNHDTRLKVEYSDDAGVTWYDPYLISATPSGGGVDLENTNAYQIGTVNAIDTSSGSITLTVVWDTKSIQNSGGSLDNTDQSDLRIRVTPKDYLEDGSAVACANFGVDNISPTGLANLAVGSSTSSTATLTWTIVTETNFNHYEIWYGMNQTDVEARGGTALEWDNTDDATLATRTTATTTITSLTSGQTYYFRAWAIDNFGNELNSNTVSQYINTIPVVNAPNTISQETDASGYITFQTTVSDADLNNTKLKVEYSDNGGTNWYDPILVSVTPSTGSTDLSNAQTYQIGSVNAIDTSTGPITLSVVWNTKSASNGNGVLTGDQSDIKIRVIPNDALEDGTARTSVAFEVDNLVPQNFANLAINGSTSTTVTLTWVSANEPNFNHYEIWYGTNQADVESRSGTASQWDQGNDVALSTLATATTTITSLTSGQTYYFRAWATDNFGNEAISATISQLTNTPPSATMPAVLTQATDGTGYVTFTTTINDGNNNNTKLKVEYSDDGGSNWYQTFLQSVTPSVGTIDLTNSNSSQIGTTDQIDTSTGNVVFTTVWDTKSASNGNGSLNNLDINSIKLRLTPNDFIENGAIQTTSLFSVDNLTPLGLANLSISSIAITSATLTWSVPTESHFSHYEIWYGTNQTDVENQNGTASRWNQVNDSNLSTLGTTNTTITGLSTNNRYYFKIWASDSLGNIASTDSTNGLTLALPTPTPTPTPSPTNTPTNSPTPIPTATSSPIQTTTPTPTSALTTITPTITPTPIVTMTPTPRLLPTSTPKLFASKTPTPITTEEITPTNAPTLTSIPTIFVPSNTPKPNKERPRIDEIDHENNQGQATITITTDVPTTTKIYWGTTLDNMIPLEDLMISLTHTIPLNDLIPNQDYYVQIIASDDGEVLSDMVTYTFNTKAQGIQNQSFVPVVISEVAVNTDQSDPVIITWQTDQPATTEIHYGTSSADLKYQNIDQTLTTNHQVKLHDLTEGQSYYYQAVSSADGGTVVHSEGSFTIKEQALLIPLISQLSENGMISSTSTVLAVGLSLIPMLQMVLHVLPEMLRSVPIFHIPGLLLSMFKKKRNPWGVVFDSQTKVPLDPVILILTNEQEEESYAVSDFWGRYEFLVEPGKYKILAQKTNYAYPSKTLANQISDGIYENLLTNEEIVVTESAIINQNIPMDLINPDWNQDEKVRMGQKPSIGLVRLKTIFIYGGFGISTLSTFLFPTVLNICLLLIYATLLFVRFGQGQGKSWGVITDHRGNLVNKAIIKLINASNPINVYPPVVTRPDGRYSFLVTKGEYQIEVQTQNPDGTYTNSVVVSKFSVDRKDGYIAKDIQL